LQPFALIPYIFGHLAGFVQLMPIPKKLRKKIAISFEIWKKSYFCSVQNIHNDNAIKFLVVASFIRQSADEL